LDINRFCSSITILDCNGTEYRKESLTPTGKAKIYLDFVAEIIKLELKKLTEQLSFRMRF